VEDGSELTPPKYNLYRNFPSQALANKCGGSWAWQAGTGGLYKTTPDCLRKDRIKKYELSEEAIKAFELLKTSMASAPVLFTFV